MMDQTNGSAGTSSHEPGLGRLVDEILEARARAGERGYGNMSFGSTLGTGNAAFQMNDDRFRHTMVLGRTGSGKSNLVQQMEREDIRNGAGVFVLAAHADDALYPLACLPEERLGDAVLLDFSNPAFLPRMNPLDVDRGDQAAVDKAVEDVLELLKDGCHNLWTGPRFEKMLRDALRLIMYSPKEEDRCLASLTRVYLEPEYVKSILRHCTDRHVFDQWTKLVPEEMRSSDSGELTHWFVSKLSRFASDRTLAHVFGAGASTLDMREVLDGGKVLVAYVPEERIGAVAARTISKWLVMQLRDAIMSRGADADCWGGLDYGAYEGGRGHEAAGGFEPFFAYVDEFARFATPDFETLLAEARKQRVGFVLSTQTLSQTRVLNQWTGEMAGLEEAILGNVGTMVCYPLGVRDADLLAEQLDVESEALVSQERYQPVARL
ncbi:MAG: TraM recognition domain-containing protein, partial [Coriobacteriales bacterium]|nr:TraM recognition domain-containing protein [Coriobacteriales bacterium]